MCLLTDISTNIECMSKYQSFRITIPKLMDANDFELSVNVIEKLSNELFYEIFEYLDGWDIYQAFSNLNNRFENLLHNSQMPLKIKLSSKSSFAVQNCCKEMIVPNKHRIISMKILSGSTAKSFTKCLTLDSSFDYLQSLTVVGIQKMKLESLLEQLPSLPRLYALNIHVYKYPQSYSNTNPYLPILHLPVLKYAKIFI